MPQIIGVQFQRAGKIYYFDSADQQIQTDTYVIVETARGIEYARVALDTHWVPEEDLEVPLKEIIRVATEEDARVYEENLSLAKEAYAICQEKIQLCELDMKLVNVEYTFDRAKVIFNFTADERVDFRELIKELAAVFHTRIELRQIGVRDEAKIVGGVGICGQPLCCHRFLTDFSPVSIKMAKEQNLSLNPAKISGCCGRLLCCLNYENEHYVESNRLAREAAKAEKLAKEEAVACEVCPQKADTQDAELVAAAEPKEAPQADNNTEITVETYYDPSLVQSTVDAMKNDNAKKRSHHDKEPREKRSHSSKDRSKNTKTNDRNNKPKKPKRPHDSDYDDSMNKHEKIEKPRKPRKRGSRGGRNRNKNNAKPKQPSNND